MKKVIGAVVALVVIGGLIAAYIMSRQEIKNEREGEKPVVSQSKVTESGGIIVVSFDEETQKRIALKVAAMAAAQYEEEVKCYGRVLDPAALSAMAADVVSARATAKASEKEVERLKTLVGQDNASARAVEGGEAAAERDGVAAEAAEHRFVATWGPRIAERKDLAALLQSLARREEVLARVELPPGELIRTELVGASLTTLADETNRVAAEVIGPAPTVDAQTQGQGFLVLVKEPGPTLVPGAAVVGYLKVGGNAVPGVAIPGDAITRFRGRSWIYVQTGTETFERREVSTGRPLGSGWLVTEKCKAGERVVVQGARMLLSEEQKRQIRMLD